jgi:ABC-type transporter MlaC component
LIRTLREKFAGQFGLTKGVHDMCHKSSSVQNLAAGVSMAVLAALAGSVPTVPVFLFVGPARAAGPADWSAGAVAPPPVARDVLRAVHDPASAQALSGVVRSYVAEPELVRSIVAQHWRRLTPDMQQEVIALFHDCLVAENADRLAQWAAGLAVTGARATEDGALVRTEIQSSSAAQPMALVWRLARFGDDSLRITDLVVAGVSMAAETRRQMAAVVQRNGGDPQAIVAVLRQRECRGSHHNASARDH